VKTIEELEAELETVTRERDMSLAAWEAAGMQGRDAQSAMLELARQLEEARQEVAEVNAVLEDINWLEDERDKARAWAHQSERERDEARAESAKWKAGFEEFRSRNTDLMMHLFEAQEKVRAVNIEPMLHLNAQLRSKVHGLSAEVDRLTDERDELLVRVANQDAELRATREVHNEARAKVDRLKLSARLWADDIDAVSSAYRRGAEDMREACAARLIAASIDRPWHAITREHAAEIVGGTPIPEEP
jgi:chromosome segregation ATPase